MDDYYEYRHVILPKEVYKKLPRGRLLTEAVPFISFRNGDLMESNNREDGSIMSCIAPNLTFCCLDDLKAVIHKLGTLLQDSSPHLMSSLHDNDFNHSFLSDISLL